mmetsp:Transcript_9801/g.13853  ORF Transcript_9801/g.13853 Transcript_9801/m.13853 type:complete len:276 (-) Transcript_9801:255-1082(-)
MLLKIAYLFAFPAFALGNSSLRGNDESLSSLLEPSNTDPIMHNNMMTTSSSSVQNHRDLGWCWLFGCDDEEEEEEEEEEEQCKVVTTAENFSVESYIDGRWYIQAQQEIQYLPIEQNNCVYAEYSKRRKTWWSWLSPKYELDVRNFSQREDGTPVNSGDSFFSKLCAYTPNKSVPSKLAVAPCFVPTGLAGPYWVVEYNAEEGWAIISGGQPTIPGDNGGCKLGTGTNNSGLWLFTREVNPSPDLVTKMKELAEEKGFDISVLNKVDHNDCDYDN